MSWLKRTPGYVPTAAEIEMEIVLGLDSDRIAHTLKSTLRAAFKKV